MLILTTLLACGSSPSTSTPANTAEVLAGADAADGTVDKVIENCPTCGLGMPGDPAHAVEHDGYELQFCSETCKLTFEEDPAQAIERLETAVKATQ